MPSSSSCATCSGLRRSARMPGVHGGVQRLHPAVEALGEAGDLLDRRDRDAGRRRSGAAVAPVLTSSTPAAARPRGQLLDPGLVVDAQQCAADRGAVGCHRELSPRRSGGGPAAATVSTRSSRSTILIRSCRRRLVVAGAAPATSRWASTGPVSTPASTTCTVAPVTVDAGGQGVAHGVRAGEGRQQRRVGVDQPAAERARARPGRRSS